MARLIGPDEGSRLVYVTTGTDRGKALASGFPVIVYSDSGATTLADIQTTAGATISGSALTVDDYSQIPLFKFPDGVDTVYVKVNGGPATAVYARTDDRLDSFTAAGSTYALRTMGRRRVGFIGDSITIGGDTYQPTAVGGVESNDSPATYAMFTSRGQWELVQNAGISGQTSTAILARLQAEIIDIGCDVCVIYSCTWNDIGNSFTVAQSIANVTAMLALCLANNVLPVLCTPTPDAVTGGSSARKNGAAQRRRRLIDLGRSYGIPVVDLFPPLADVTTGALASTYNAGDIHPNSVGRQVGGAAVAAVLDRVLAGSAASDLAYAGDTDDLLAGFGFFVTDTNADGVADGWTANTVSGAVASVFTDSVLGKVQRMTTTATAGNYQFSRSGLTVTPGHVYEVSGYISKNGTSTAQLSLNPTSGNRRLTLPGAAPDVTRGKFSLRWIPSTGNSSATLFLVAGAGTGTVDFGRLAIRDLTALGLT